MSLAVDSTCTDGPTKVSGINILGYLNRWLASASQKDLGSLALSQSATEMLLILRSHLHTVEQMLARPMFTMFWHKVAEDLNMFFFKEVRIKNLCFNAQCCFATETL